MANRTVKEAISIKGTNPQYLIEKITRSRIYECRYWKEECFALSGFFSFSLPIWLLKYYYWNSSRVIGRQSDGIEIYWRCFGWKYKADSFFVFDFENAANSSRERYYC